jgi:hypothetical protein
MRCITNVVDRLYKPNVQVHRAGNIKPSQQPQQCCALLHLRTRNVPGQCGTALATVMQDHTMLG